MSDKLKNGVQFDRDFWPKTDTTLPQRPFDLNDLWEEDCEKVELFVAEALLEQEHFISIGSDFDELRAYLWDIGGDVMMIRASLIEALEEAEDDHRYSPIRGPAQYDDVLMQIKKLNTLQNCIEQIKTRLQQTANQWITSQQEK